MRNLLGSWQRKLLLLAVIIISLGYLYQNTTTLSLAGIKSTVVRQLDEAQIRLGLNSNSNTTVYSSVDDNGVMVYSDKAPPDSANAKSIIIDNNVNLIPATPPNKKAPTIEPDSAIDKSADISATTPYTEPEKIIKLLNDAKNIQDVLNDRKTNLDRQLDQM